MTWIQMLSIIRQLLAYSHKTLSAFQNGIEDNYHGRKYFENCRQFTITVKSNKLKIKLFFSKDNEIALSLH
jgi:hypothetical protein